ncbi:MAG: hypothetical protein IT445_06905 [Phycisphaeraceae bacterium]|nr:hypothetical protein [Phycisphaeraceae bacterium]
MSNKPKYIVTLEAMPDPLDRDPVQRLKQALKLLGRACGFRCTWIAEADAGLQDKESKP